MIETIELSTTAELCFASIDRHTIRSTSSDTLFFCFKNLISYHGLHHLKQLLSSGTPSPHSSDSCLISLLVSSNFILARISTHS